MLKNSVQKISGKRNYQESYIEYGFIEAKSNTSLPYCLNCAKTLANKSMVPNKLQRHLELLHPELKNKPKVYFEQLHSNLLSQSKRMKKFTTVP